ncbi:MAG: protein-L-isoaspartate(D-aspartate) O-methyltransferase [Nitrospinae bacterium]|nr:protein-L-isoaspartate(D-aspartate) O-methyltransferase [Nitrospinota bacterium]
MPLTPFTDSAIQQYAGQRRKMVEELVNRGIKDYRVMEAMSRVPRHLLVGESFQHKAYGDHPLPIGESQTISQPYVVALMTEALQLKGGERVLEIGTGSGYQTAILAELAAQVFTIERIRSIGQNAKARLEQLGYMNVVYKVFDGTYGWRDLGPYDAIILTASGPEVPPVLIEQLKDGGRLVAPVGEQDNQQLVAVVKNGARVARRTIGNCSFVRMIGKYGWPEEQ